MGRVGPLGVYAGFADKLPLGAAMNNPRLIPCTTPLERVYLCSAATPPGGGVHGMCGFLAAEAALRLGSGRG
jgi:phytoene dehydrogenase-like protein